MSLQWNIVNKDDQIVEFSYSQFEQQPCFPFQTEQQADIDITL
jgi:hypothetical protein